MFEMNRFSFVCHDSNIFMILNLLILVLVLRAITLILALLSVFTTNWKAKRPIKGLGNVAVMWLGLTWISTVILGVPICTAIFGDPKVGLKYGIMAGISSFMFQLPLQLMFLECHAAEENERSSEGQSNTQQVVPAPTKDVTSISITVEGAPVQNFHPPEETNVIQNWWSLVHVDDISYTTLWLDIGKRVVTNPVLIAICLGFVISLSTAGKYLRCPSNTCIPGLEWIGATLGWLGACISPLSLFSMGAWIHSKRQLMLIPLPKLCVSMASKLIIVPLIMVALAKGMDMNNEAGRAAILIASLPISMASFSLAHQYNIGEKDLAANVTFGTILMLPAVILWNIVLDKVGVYPLE